MRQIPQRRGGLSPRQSAESGSTGSVAKKSTTKPDYVLGASEEDGMTKSSVRPARSSPRDGDERRRMIRYRENAVRWPGRETRCPKHLV